MFDAIIGALLFAWFLSWFGFHQMFNEAAKDILGVTLSFGTYYFVFFVGGIVIGVINTYKKKSE